MRIRLDNMLLENRKTVYLAGLRWKSENDKVLGKQEYDNIKQPVRTAFP